MARKPKRSAVVKTIVKKEVIEIESDTDEVGDRMLALCGVENAPSNDDALAKSPMKSSVDKTVVKKEIIEIQSHSDEVGGGMLAICGVENASGNNDALATNPKKPAVAKSVVKKEIIEINSDTDEVGGRMLALCGVENASESDAIAKSPKKSAVAKSVVEKEIIQIESDTDEDGGRMLALCGVENASGSDAIAKSPKKTVVKKEITETESDSDKVTDGMLPKVSGSDAMAKIPKTSAVAKSVVEKEIIEIESDSDTDEVDGRMLAPPCSAGNASGDDTFAKDGGTGTNRHRMQIVCADDCDTGLVLDLEYKKFLAQYNVTANLYLLEDSARGTSPMRVMSNIDNETSGRSQGRAVKTSRAGRKAKPPTISNVSKRLKTENGRAAHKSVSGTKEIQPKKEVGRRGRKVSVAKENVKLKRTRVVKSQKICRASKRLKTEFGKADHKSISKTIPGVKTKDTPRKKREAMQGKEIHVTKHNVKSKSSNHVKEDLIHSFKASKKENEVSLSSSMDRSYTYFLANLRKSIAILKPDRQVKPVKPVKDVVKDIVSLSDPDIIAISNHPFSDEGKSPFEANKDRKVIDLEDGVQLYDIFNSLFSKKLMEILRKPYDQEEFLRLYNEASLKRPLTRSRQLRNGVEIEYNIDDQLAPSYLDKYKDFNKKYLRYGKDLPRALNLLRGFFFYLENIVLEGAFKPWVHEERLTDVCFDASGYNDIACNTPPALEGHRPALEEHLPALEGHLPALEGHPPALKGHLPALEGHLN